MIMTIPVFIMTMIMTTNNNDNNDKENHCHIDRSNDVWNISHTW